MKILYVVGKLKLFGGIEKIVTDKANYLVDNGIADVAVLSLENEINDTPVFPLNSAIKLYNCPCEGFSSSIAKLRKLRMGYKSVIGDFTPDIIVFTRPLFLEMSLFNLMYPNVKKILELHACYEIFNYGERYFNNFVKQQDKSFEKLANLLFPNVSALMVLTDRDNKLWNYSNAITLVDFSDYKSDSLSDCSSKTVIAVGRYCYQKGLDLLIESWIPISKIHPDWKLEIWGDGELREDLQKLIDDNDMSDLVTLMGYGKADKLVDIYSEAAFFVLSSRYEGFGIVSIEAQRCGLPVVTFDLPSGPAEVINDGVDGYLCDYLDVEMLSEKMMLLIENEDKRKAMGKCAYENSFRFSKDIIMDKWIRLFNEVIEEKRTSAQKKKEFRSSLKVVYSYLKSDIRKLCKRS